MAAVGEGIRIRLEPEDEYTHPIEAAENFNESMYFNLFDPERKLGGGSAWRTGRTKGKGRCPSAFISPMAASPSCLSARNARITMPSTTVACALRCSSPSSGYASATKGPSVSLKTPWT